MTLALAAAKQQAPLVAVDDTFTHPQTQAGAANPFCRVKSLEHVLARLRAHARTRVRNGDHKPMPTGAPVAPLTTPQEQCAATAVHGVDGIAYDIANHLGDFGGIADDEFLCPLAFLNHDPRIDQTMHQGKHPTWPGVVLQKIIQPAAIKAGITKQIGWHTFRHTCSTLLIANGENVKVVQES